MRSYKASHPWIKFSHSEVSRDPTIWLLLGKCTSVCEHIAGVPLQPAVEEELRAVYLAKGIHGTTAIEGNTLSEDDVRAMLAGRLDVPRSREYLKREARNILTVCNLITRRQELGDPYPFTPETIKLFNRHVLDGLDFPDEVQPGKVRRHSVGVARYRGAPWKDCEYLLAKLCDWLNGPSFRSNDEELRVPLAILRAVIAHVYIAWIHPFGDGNGRTARLVEFMILLGSGVPSPVGHLLSNHYNLTRSKYIQQLVIATQKKGDLVEFVTYAVQGLLDGLRGQWGMIRESHLRILWQHLVTEAFSDRKSVTTGRRRDVLMALSHMDEPVPIANIPVSTSELRKHYANRTDQTLRRDIRALEAAGFVKISGGKVAARIELIEAFLPPSGIAPDSISS